MLAWLAANGGTLLVLAVVLLIVGLILRKTLNDRRAGKSSCGNNCAHCAMQGSCHQLPQK